MCPAEWPCVSVLFSVGVERIQSFSLCPVRGLPSDCHQRLPIDSHTAQTVTHYLGLHFPSSIALITHRCNLSDTPYKPSTSPFWSRVLFSVYHCDSYFTDPVLVFIVLPVFLCSDSCLSILDYHFVLPFRLRLPLPGLLPCTWIISLCFALLDYVCHRLTLACLLDYSFVLPSIYLCAIVWPLPVYWTTLLSCPRYTCVPLSDPCLFWLSFNKALQMDPHASRPVHSGTM